jgi:hypothetical protein
LRHIQVGADEDTAAAHLALGAQIRKTDEVHGICLSEMGSVARGGALASQ